MGWRVVSMYVLLLAERPAGPPTSARLHGIEQRPPQASSHPTPSTWPVAFQRVGNPSCVIPSPFIFGGFMALSPHPWAESPADGHSVLSGGASGGCRPCTPSWRNGRAP